MSTTPAAHAIPGLDDSNRRVPPTVGDTRYPLGLPAGSVRAFLAFSVLGLLWALVLTYRSKEHPLPPIYPYLQFLMALILAHYFAAHGSSIGGPARQRSPLFLPRGSVRLLLTAGVVGLIVWFIYHWDEYGPEAVLPTLPFQLPIALLSGFLAGYLIHKVVRKLSGENFPFWFQDLEAWVALVSVFALAAALVFHVLILPTLENADQWQFKHSDIADPILAGMISFYFGARS
jgi:hypothetical protein